jgi:hypothetical protein
MNIVENNNNYFKELFQRTMGLTSFYKRKRISFRQKCMDFKPVSISKSVPEEIYYKNILVSSHWVGPCLTCWDAEDLLWCVSDCVCPVQQTDLP